MPGLVFFEHAGHSPLELACSAADRLMGIAGTVFDDDRVPADEPGLKRALNFIRCRFGVADFICQMRLNPGHVFAKSVQRVLDHGTEVLGHLVAPVNVRVGVQ